MKFVKKLPYISGLVIIFIPLMAAEINGFFQFPKSIIRLFSSNPIVAVASLIMLIFYLYLFINFFIKFIQAYKDKNAIVYYFNKLIIYLIIIFCFIAFSGGIYFYLSNPMVAPKPLLITSTIFNAGTLIFLLACLFYHNKLKNDFIISKDRFKNIAKLFALFFLSTILAYVIGSSDLFLVFQSTLGVAIPFIFISCLLILPFYKIWNRAVDSKKYNNWAMFLSAQVIISNILLYVLTAFYMLLVLFKIVSAT